MDVGLRLRGASTDPIRWWVPPRRISKLSPPMAGESEGKLGVVEEGLRIYERHLQWALRRICRVSSGRLQFRQKLKAAEAAAAPVSGATERGKAAR